MLKGFYYCPLITNPHHKNIAGFELWEGQKATCAKCGAPVYWVKHPNSYVLDLRSRVRHVFSLIGRKPQINPYALIVHGDNAVYDVS